MLIDLFLHHELQFTLLIVMIWQFLVIIRIFAASTKKHTVLMLLELTIHCAVLTLIMTAVQTEAEQCPHLKREFDTLKTVIVSSPKL